MTIDEESLKENENLEYINVRENKLERSEELIKFKIFSNLKTFIFTSNPVMNKE